MTGGTDRRPPAMPDRGAHRRTGRLADLALGIRMIFAGGRDGATRTVMTALGVGLGVALLLLATAAPDALAARGARSDARSGVPVDSPGPDTLLVQALSTTFRGAAVKGSLLQAGGPQAPRPPGIDRLPAVGEAFASPALRDVLASPDGALLRPRVPYPIVGTIGDAGLAGPDDLLWYAGSDALTAATAIPVSSFGAQATSSDFDPVLVMLLVVIVVALLLPVAVFLASAVRFGSDQRDRRLAALRLLGADRAMARRIASGEALGAALLGLVVGAALFLIGRHLPEWVRVERFSVFAADLRPDPALALAVAAAVPALAVAVNLLSLQKVVIEPLGVVRRGGEARGRLWWRLVPPAAGLLLLMPLVGEVTSTGEPVDVPRVTVGFVLTLLGVALLLPWVVRATVGRWRGGPVAWQLAIRRLQLHSGSSGRMVNGIAVAVAGAIAVQMLFTEIEPSYTRQTGDELWADTQIGAVGAAGPALRARLGTATGVADMVMTWEIPLGSSSRTKDVLLVADCADLRRLAAVPTCRDGSLYRTAAAAEVPAAGISVDLPTSTPRWRVPPVTATVGSARTAYGASFEGLLATPTAVPAQWLVDTRVNVMLLTDPGHPDAAEKVRNEVAAADPAADVTTISNTTVSDQFDTVRRALLVTAILMLLLIGLSLFVGIGEQLRERRRILAVVAAFGTRRRTLGWSVLWQTAVPVALGLAVAVPVGLGLGAVLLLMTGRPVLLDFAAVTAMAAGAAAVVLLVTLGSLPLLWRVMRAEGLRTE